MTINNAKNAIRNAFIELYKTYGIDQITIDMICKEAYLSRSTFYKHYKNIDALVAEVEEEVRNEMIRINKDYNYQNIFDIDINYPSPNFVEMFRCVLRYKDYFIGAYSAHGNPLFYNRSKKMSAQFLKDHILAHDPDVAHIDIICDICSDYIINSCKMIIRYENELSPKGLAIEVKKQIIDFVNNEELYIKNEDN